jgi:hypothetical protein
VGRAPRERGTHHQHSEEQTHANPQVSITRVLQVSDIRGQDGSSKKAVEEILACIVFMGQLGPHSTITEPPATFASSAASMFTPFSWICQCRSTYPQFHHVLCWTTRGRKATNLVYLSLRILPSICCERLWKSLPNSAAVLLAQHTKLNLTPHGFNFSASVRVMRFIDGEKCQFMMGPSLTQPEGK